MKDFSYITNSHPAFIEGLYQQFLTDPASVDPDIIKFFEGFDFAMQNGTAAPAQGASAPSSLSNVSADWANEIKVYRLILGYRNKGHLIATTNPISSRKDRGANLDLACFELTEADLDKTFQVGSIIGLGATTLKNILSHLQKTYAHKFFVNGEVYFLK